MTGSPPLALEHRPRHRFHRRQRLLWDYAFGWKASEDILSNLLDQNLELAEREKAGEKVVGPWAPA